MGHSRDQRRGTACRDPNLPRDHLAPSLCSSPRPLRIEKFCLRERSGIRKHRGIPVEWDDFDNTKPGFIIRTSANSIDEYTHVCISSAWVPSVDEFDQVLPVGHGHMV